MLRLFCNHDFKLVNQFEMISEYDIVVDNKMKPSTYCSMTRKFITDYKCSKCSKLKRLIEKTENKA